MGDRGYTVVKTPSRRQFRMGTEGSQDFLAMVLGKILCMYQILLLKTSTVLLTLNGGKMGVLN